MSKIPHGRVKRLTTEFRGDDAVDFEILEVTLRLDEVARTKQDADALLIRLAFKALHKAIAEYCGDTGVRYPSYKDVSRYLDAGGGADDNEGPKVVSLPG